MKRRIFVTMAAMLAVALLFAVPISGLAVAYAESTDGKTVYLGGTPMGISLGFEGVVVDELVPVMGKDGAVRPAEMGGIRKGDLIYMIDEVNIYGASDIVACMPTEEREVSVRVKRGEKEMVFALMPKYDVIAGGLRLGMKVKDELAGVGTLTFVTDGENKYFAALGHKIFDATSGVGEEFRYGSIYKCTIGGVVKGEEGKPGELRGSFSKADVTIGNLQLNNFAGIFGDAELALYEGRPKVELGSRAEIKPGKAYIYTTLDGNTPEKYQIEIVKAENQSYPAMRSMVIHVTDDKLLATTGGIVQGMSGSPIVQNGKLVGAVTHVFINDPTRGFGIYADWMEENCKSLILGDLLSYNCI